MHLKSMCVVSHIYSACRAKIQRVCGNTSELATLLSNPQQCASKPPMPTEFLCWSQSLSNYNAVKLVELGRTRKSSIDRTSSQPSQSPIGYCASCHLLPRPILPHSSSCLARASSRWSASCRVTLARRLTFASLVALEAEPLSSALESPAASFKWFQALLQALLQMAETLLCNALSTLCLCSVC